jgi:hypothetical protein
VVIEGIEDEEVRFVGVEEIRSIDSLELDGDRLRVGAPKSLPGRVFGQTSIIDRVAVDGE